MKHGAEHRARLRPTAPDPRLECLHMTGDEEPVCWQEKFPFSTHGSQFGWNLLEAATLSISLVIGLSGTKAGAFMEDRRGLERSGTLSVWTVTYSVTSERSLLSFCPSNLSWDSRSQSHTRPSLVFCPYDIQVRPGLSLASPSRKHTPRPPHTHTHTLSLSHTVLGKRRKEHTVTSRHVPRRCKTSRNSFK